MHIHVQFLYHAQTIFEINSTKKGNTSAEVMRMKRNYHGNAISMKQKKKELTEENDMETATGSEKVMTETSETEVNVRIA